MTPREQIAELELKVCYLQNEIEELRALLTLDDLETYTVGSIETTYAAYAEYVFSNDWPESYI